MASPVATRREEAAPAVSGLAVLSARREPARRRPVATLALFLAAFIAVQLLSIPAGQYALHRVDVAGAMLGGGAPTDAQSQWSAYLALPSAPDVLFIGDSMTLTDVDPAAISRLLSGRAGRPVTVGRLGILAERPDFLEALVYRVMHRPSRPRLVLFELNATTLSAAGRWDPSFDLWQVSYPLDAGFMKLAYDLDPDRDRLVRGWVLPMFMTYIPIATLVQCTGTAYLRGAVIRAHQTMPLELRQPTPCDSGDDWNLRFARATVDAGGILYWSPEQVRAVAQAARLVREAGSEIAYLQYPTRQLAVGQPYLHMLLVPEVQRIGADAGAPSIDLSGELTENTDLWFDDVHMRAAGAAALAPLLATIAGDPAAYAAEVARRQPPPHGR